MGEIVLVWGIVFDFIEEVFIGSCINDVFGGYDYNFDFWSGFEDFVGDLYFLNGGDLFGDGFCIVVKVWDFVSRCVMEVFIMVFGV